MLPKLAWGADTNYMQRLTGKRVAPRAGKGRYSTAKGVAGRMREKKKKSVWSPCIFQGCIGKRRKSALLLVPGSSSALPDCSSHTDVQLVRIQGARRWHSRMCSYIAWVCQPNKADDVSLWLLFYQLITLGKLWSGFCMLLALGLLIRYSFSVL